MLLNLENIIKKYNININGVLHVGGHHGEEADLYDDLGVKKVIFFEPDPNNCVILLNKIKNFNGYEVSQCAIGSERDVLELNIASNNGASNSLLKPKKHLNQYPHIKFNSSIQVDVFPLDDAKINREDFNFMNVDVQGFELEVFKGAKEVLNYIDGIICEVNRDEVYEGCPMVEEIDEFLKEYGFERVETTWDGGTWGDAYYHKNRNKNSRTK